MGITNSLIQSGWLVYKNDEWIFCNPERTHEYTPKHTNQDDMDDVRELPFFKRTESPDLDTACPICGNATRIVWPKVGNKWKAFRSCISWPTCKGTRRMK
jgi:hypothetical protein